MPAKKPRPQRNMAGSDTVTVNSDYGVGSWSSHNIDLGNMASDTITLDPLTWTTGSSGNYSITSSPYVYTSGTTGSYSIAPASNSVHINGDGIVMQDGADIVVGGKSLTQAIEKIEQRLAILKPNPELESRWQQLQDLREQYVEMERDLLEKEKIMKILKEC